MQTGRRRLSQACGLGGGADRAAGQASYFLSNFCLSASLSGAGSGSEREVEGTEAEAPRARLQDGCEGRELVTKSYKPWVKLGGDRGTGRARGQREARDSTQGGDTAPRNEEKTAYTLQGPKAVKSLN